MKEHIKWWQTVSVADRFALMKKHNIKQVNDKLIKRMWFAEGFNES